MRSLDHIKLHKIIGVIVSLAVLGTMGGFAVQGYWQWDKQQKLDNVAKVFTPLGATSPIEVYFAPTDNVQDKIIGEIAKAQKTIDCSLYGITQNDIALALIVKQRNGVKVRIGEDKMQSAGKSDKHEILQKNGVDVTIKKTSVLEHDKYCVIDNQIVLEGSYNYSDNARSQDNSFLIIRDKGIADKFEKQFEWILNRDK